MAPRLFPEGQGWHGPQLRHRHLPHHGPGNHLRRLLRPSIRDDLRCTEGEYVVHASFPSFFTPGWWDELGMESWSGLGRQTGLSNRSSSSHSLSFCPAPEKALQKMSFFNDLPTPYTKHPSLRDSRTGTGWPPQGPSESQFTHNSLFILLTLFSG